MNVASTTCASSHRDVDWHGIDWVKCHRTVRRLQARMVKATHWEAGSREGALRGLSCMPRKRLVQFLGGWGLATAPGYPSVPSMFNSLEVKVLYPT